MKDFCKKHGLTEDQFSGKKTVGGYLDLGSFADSLKYQT